MYAVPGILQLLIIIYCLCACILVYYTNRCNIIFWLCRLANWTSYICAAHRFINTDYTKLNIFASGEYAIGILNNNLNLNCKFVRLYNRNFESWHIQKQCFCVRIEMRDLSQLAQQIWNAELISDKQACYSIKNGECIGNWNNFLEIPVVVACVTLITSSFM